MCESIATCILIAANIGVLLLGVVMTVIGAMLQWAPQVLTNSIGQFLNLLSGTTGVAGSGSATVSMAEISALVGDYVKYLSAAGLVIFIVGLVLLVISVCGVCGACRKSKLLLVVYVALVGIILVGMIVLTCLIAFKKNDVRTGGHTFFKNYIRDTFVGISAGTNAQSAILSLVMARLSCCGVTNSSDFSAAAAPKWNRTYQFPGNGTVIQLTIPLTCCKMKTGSWTPKDNGCLTSPNSTNSNMETGCYTKLWQLIDNYSQYTMYVLIGICVILFILIICAIAVMRSASKDSSV